MRDESKQFPSRLKHKLALRVTLGAVFFALISVSVNTWFVFDRQHTAARTLQNHLAATVKSSAAVAAFARNEEIARDVISGLLTNPLVAAADITGDNGTSIFYGRKPSAQGANSSATVRYPLPSPIKGNEVIGQLVVELDTAYVDANARDSALRQSMVLALQIVISTALLLVLFDLIVARSLTRLAREVQETVPGTSARLDLPSDHGDDEIGSLVHSSNKLLATVERTLDEERALRAKVEKIEAHYRRIFETTNVGIMVLNQEGHLVNSNPALLSRIIGIQLDGIPQAQSIAFIETVFVKPQAVWTLIGEATQTHRSSSDDCQLRTQDGSERWVHCIISVVAGQQGQIELIEGVLYDVTDRKVQENQSRSQAELDALTGLSNRRGMEVFLDRSLRHAAEDAQVVAVMLLDLDGFKAVNDSRGHDAGDQVLKIVASRMQERIRRSTDVVARQGGDEFVVIQANCGTDTRPVEELARDLVALLGQPFDLSDGSSVHIGASIGIARYPFDDLTRKGLLAAADAAMYRAKKSGKNAYSFSSGGAQVQQGKKP